MNRLCLPVALILFLGSFTTARAQQEWGTLEGRAAFKGKLPEIKSLEPRIRRHSDRDKVLEAPKEDLLDPTWHIDQKTKGVANVVISIARAEDGKLPIHADDKVRKEPIEIDAPFSFLKPHVAAVYPVWFDGKERGQTGQKFFFKNSSIFPMCVKGNGGEENGHFNYRIPRGKTQEVRLSTAAVPFKVSCIDHDWAFAYICVFDHPYFAITKADGTFIIPRVPAGMEVQIMAWHEGVGYLLNGKHGKTMKLAKGKNTLDLEITKPK